MQQMTEGFGYVWLLLAEANSWDGRRLMDGWLEEHAVLIEAERFQGIEARHYMLDKATK